jgi:NAD(P)-dependent dehydrogenase (short-subunit alcohol dehydrogenase family)
MSEGGDERMASNEGADGGGESGGREARDVTNLDGRVAIVTGGGRHLGRAYARALAAAGASVIVADIMDATPVADEIRSDGGSAEAVRLDVTDPASTEAMAAFAVERFGRIDVLLNNAGYFKQTQRGPWHEIDLDEWNLAFDVNVRGVWLCCKAVFPHMKEQRYGKIINIGSNTVWKGSPGNFLHYISSKSAIIGLTRALAREVGEFGICVNLLAPDYIPDQEQLRLAPEADEFVISQRVLKRTETPEDMLGAVLFLAGPGSDFVTGQSLLVNGGVWFN